MRALLDSGIIGAKLEVGAVDDPAEHEADRMADDVVSGNGISTQLRNSRAPVAAKARSAETASFLADAKGVQDEVSAPWKPIILNHVLIRISATCVFMTP